MRAAAVRADSRPPRSLAIAVARHAGRAARAVRLARLARVAALLISPIVLTFEVVAPVPSRAGAWLRAPGESYVKAALFRTRGTDQFDGSGTVSSLADPTQVSSSRYVEWGSSLYVEHGAARDLTLFAGALVKTADLRSIDRRVASDVGGVSFGMPDVRLGARLPLARRRIVAAVEPSVDIPLRAVGRSSPSAPSVGSPSAAAALAVSIGGAVPVLRGYGQASAGYRARAGREPDEWFGDLEAGLAPFGPLRLRVRYDTVDARGGGATPGGRDGGAGMVVPETGGQDLRRVAPAVALALRGRSEVSVTWRRAIAGRSALRTSEWEVAYAFLGGARAPAR